jgi:predicted dehydrogenase
LASGAIGSLQAGWCVPDTEGWRVEIWGDRGRLLLVDNSFGNLLSAKLYAGDGRLLTYGERTCAEVEIDPAFYNVPGTISGESGPRPYVAMDWMFAKMAEAVRSGSEGSPSFAEAAAVYRVVEAVEQASAERCWVRTTEPS